MLILDEIAGPQDDVRAVDHVSYSILSYFLHLRKD